MAKYIGCYECNNNGETSNACICDGIPETTDGLLRDLVQSLIADIGHPVGMGIPLTDAQADIIIQLVRKWDSMPDTAPDLSGIKMEEKP